MFLTSPKYCLISAITDISFIIQNVLRLLSMLSLQQQNNMMNTNNNQHLPPMSAMMPPMTGPTPPQPQQENQHERSLANSQQGLADKIQAVRHLWESENQYPGSSTHVHPMSSYSQQQSTAALDPALYNHMNVNLPHATTSAYIQFQS
jgi:hypothetical protein